MAEQVASTLVATTAVAASVAIDYAIYRGIKKSLQCPHHSHSHKQNVRPLFPNAICRYCKYRGDCYKDSSGLYFCQNVHLCQKRKMAQNSKSGKANGKMLKSGYMMKKGYWNTSYKERYFKLWSNGKMSYFDRARDSTANGHFQLYPGTDSVEMKSHNLFEVITRKRTWSFICRNANEAKQWVDSICALIERPPIIKYKVDDEKSQILEPGVKGYKIENKENPNMGTMGWEESVPPPAFTGEEEEVQPGSTAAVAISAMKVSDDAPSAPAEESGANDESVSEGIVTGDIDECITAQ